MTVDLNKSPGKTVDPVNPYAVIALVASLLGLIPVAIVFGILAFWRPAGRGLSYSARSRPSWSRPSSSASAQA